MRQKGSGKTSNVQWKEMKRRKGKFFLCVSSFFFLFFFCLHALLDQVEDEITARKREFFRIIDPLSPSSSSLSFVQFWCGGKFFLHFFSCLSSSLHTRDFKVNGLVAITALSFRQLSQYQISFLATQSLYCKFFPCAIAMNHPVGFKWEKFPRAFFPVARAEEQDDAINRKCTN